MSNESINQQIIELFRRKLNQQSEDTSTPFADTLLRTIDRLSADYQYSNAVTQSKTPECLEGLTIATEFVPETACFQGVEGAWSHIATKKMYPDAKWTNVARFNDVFLAVNEGTVDVGIVPIDNTTAGAVAEVYESLINYNLNIIKCYSLPVAQCLAANTTDLSKITRVFSHPQALAQCTTLLETLNAEIFPAQNTAVAAQEVLQSGNMADAVLCSRDAAILYGLNVLVADASDTKHNQTRFIAVTKAKLLLPNADKVSLYLTLPHQSGSLSAVISAFQDFGISMTKIQSRPLPEKPWEYCFYIDFEGNVSEHDTQTILLKFEAELPIFKFLGNYSEIN
ncbi:MAG: prephenate dehydratase domain-containing protein [Clostridia bacterium]